MRSIRRFVALVAVMGMPVVAYALALACLTIWEGRDPAPLADPGVALEDGLMLLTAAVGATIAAYLAVTGYAMLLGALWRGGRAIPHAVAALAPAGWTRLTAAALGLSMTAGLAAPALAADAGTAPVPSAGWVNAPVSVVVDPAPMFGAAAPAIGWVEAHATTTNARTERGDTPLPAPALAPVVTAAQSVPHAIPPAKTTPPQPAPAQAAPTEVAHPPTAPIVAPPQAPSTHVVQPGESLWRITEALLGEGADATRVAEAWPQLYEANRTAIGANPGLIQPGLALTIPVGLGA